MLRWYFAVPSSRGHSSEDIVRTQLVYSCSFNCNQEIKSHRRSNPAFVPQNEPKCSCCVAAAALHWQRVVACVTPRERKLAGALSDVRRACERRYQAEDSAGRGAARPLRPRPSSFGFPPTPPTPESHERASGFVRSVPFPVAKHEVGSV